MFDGFSDPVNNRGWAMRLEMDKTGVRNVEVHVAQIGPGGLPKPAGTVAGP